VAKLTKDSLILGKKASFAAHFPLAMSLTSAKQWKNLERRFTQENTAVLANQLEYYSDALVNDYAAFSVSSSRMKRKQDIEEQLVKRRKTMDEVNKGKPAPSSPFDEVCKLLCSHNAF
jgi:hypothetical protein